MIKLFLISVTLGTLAGALTREVTGSFELSMVVSVLVPFLLVGFIK